MTIADISVVIPTFDMAEHLPRLLATLRSSGLWERVREIVIVNDGSSDGTRDILEQAVARDEGGVLHAVHLPRNVGRFRARLAGAEAARSDRILFLDTRVTLGTGFGASLVTASEEAPSVMGHVDIDVTRNVFCLYWDRSHRFIFRRHYRDTREALVLDAENYDRYLKGTGVFLCQRELFLRVSRELGDLFSDDTLLMKEMVRETPIRIDPRVRIGWVPREDARAFLARIWERGPGFVEYHVLERRGPFFYAVLAGGLLAFGGLGLALAAPPLAGGVIAVAAGGTVLSTALFARSLDEFVRLAPLHTAVVGTFGASVVRGLWVNARRRWAPSRPAAV